MADPTPTSYQQGQGLAQIFQGNMAADVYMYQQQLRQQQEAERRKKADLAAKELSGKFDALNKKAIFETRDTDAFRNMIKTNIQDKYAGRWEELYKGDTPLRADLEKDLLDVSLWADQSAATKKELQGIWKDAFQDNADKYTAEQRNVIENLMTTPGTFNIPYKELIPFENVDLETTFKKLAYEPAAKEAADRFTTDKGWRGLESYGSLSQTKLPDESVESHWTTFISDPKVQNALYHRYGKEAEAAGMELNEYVKTNTPYYDRLKIDKKKTNYGLVKDGGDDKSFNAGSITQLNKMPLAIPTGDDKSKRIATSKQGSLFYPLNYSVSVPSNNGIDISTGEKLESDLLLNGTMTGLVKEGNEVRALVRTGDGYDISVPFEHVYNQGRQRGYDMDNIYNGFVQSAQGGNKYVPGYQEGGYEFKGGDPSVQSNWKKL